MLYDVYVGSYVKAEGQGITHCELDTEKKSLSRIGDYHVESPSFLVVRRDRVFALSEVDEGGAITSFLREPSSGALTETGSIRTQGSAMCHLCLWPDGRYLSAANYMSGSLLVCEVEENGKIGAVVSRKQHSGVGFESRVRQEGPHVHSTMASGDGKRLYVADLGLDQLFCYEILEKGGLRLGEEAMQIHTPGGTGPRHFTFSRDERFLYLVTEMGNRLFVYETEDGGKTFRQIQDIGTLPQGYEGESLSADIHLSADGRFLYTSNRGADDLAVFSVSSHTGMVEFSGHYGCGGAYPRNFCITPDDGFIMVANQHSGNVALFERNRENGALGEKLAEIAAPTASYVGAVGRE